MHALPHNPLLDIEFPTITAFVKTWAKQYEGGQPRTWLKLQRQLQQVRDLIKDEKSLNDWNNAWANEYTAAGPRAYYCTLNIINAVKDYFQLETKEIDEIIGVYHKCFDKLPHAPALWKKIIESWCDSDDVTKYTEAFLVSPYISAKKPGCRIFVQSMLDAFESRYFILMHQTHPDEELAEAIVELGWRAFSVLYDENTTLSMKAYADFPWNAFNTLAVKQTDTINLNIDDLI